MATHIFDDISRYSALNALDTARRLASRRITSRRSDSTYELEAAMDALNIAKEAIMKTAPVRKATFITRLRSSITGRFVKPVDTAPATSDTDMM